MDNQQNNDKRERARELGRRKDRGDMKGESNDKEADISHPQPPFGVRLL